MLRDVQKFSWSEDAQKIVVIIGDAPPHEAKDTPDKIDWRTEAQALLARGIKVHGVQALSYKESTHFYKTIASITGGHYFQLDQFALLTAFLVAVSFGAHSHERVIEYEQELKERSGITRSLHAMFDTLLGRAPAAGAGPVDGAFAASDVDAVPLGRFQVLTVDHDIPIKDFAQANGLIFKAGKGFYEFTKPEAISDGKEIVLMDKGTGDMFSGTKARDLLGLTAAGSGKFRPVALDKYRVFVQSTSYNRKLIGGTGFLYEVDETK